jgi:hypothetical protein
MSSLSHEDLESALALSARMAERGAANDWDAVVALQQERDASLHRGHPADARSRELLMRIVEQNMALQAAAFAARQHVEQELGINRRNHRAAGAYLSAARA